jgi:BASS family bile acid:Na+ symporter
MKESVLTSVVLPLSLFIIMLGMGMGLVVDDFKRVVRFPVAMVAGLFNQLVMLPLIGFGLAIAFGLEPLMAVGLMLLAACPGGVTSNLITHVSKGDTALSITMTAVNSFVTVVTIPLIVAFSLGHFMAESKTIEVPVVKMILQVVAITIVPVSLGMLVRKFKPDFADRMDRPARIASTVIFTVIVIGLIAANTDLLKKHFLPLSGVTIALNVATMALGFVIAKVARLNLRQSIAITIESGIQNGTLAIVIGTTLLAPLLEGEFGDAAGNTTLPAAVYSLIMFMTGAALMTYFGRRDDSAEDAAPAAEAA